MSLKSPLPLLIFLPSLSWTLPANAHSAVITYQQTQAIQIQALYDQGQPLADAQVVIYAPADPGTAWLTGTTDSEGRFTFVPDYSQPGNWDIKVREAGHGALISIPITTDNTTAQTTPVSNPTYTTPQKLLMAATGVWGFVGTALFFSRPAKG